MAFLAVLAAALLLVVAGILAALAGTLLSAQAWLGSLEDARAYERAPTAIADQVVAWTGARLDDRPRTLAPLDGSDVRAVVVVIVTPEWLRQEAARVVPSVVSAAIEGGETRVVVSLRDLKDRLSEGPILGALLDRIATWPPCTGDELDRLAGGDLIRCRPPADMASQMAVIISGRLGTVAAELPDEVDLGVAGETPGSGALAAAGLPETLTVAAAARGVLWGLALAVLLLVGLAVLAAGGPAGRRLRTLAAPLLGGGLAILLLALGIDGFLAGAVESLRRALADGGMVPAMIEIVASAARALLDRAGWQLAWTGAGMTLLGVLLLVVGYLTERREPGSSAAGRIAAS